MDDLNENIEQNVDTQVQPEPLNDFGQEAPDVEQEQQPEQPAEPEQPAQEEQQDVPCDASHFEKMAETARNNLINMFGPPPQQTAPQAPVQPVQATPQPEPQPVQTQTAPQYVSPITNERVPDPNTDFVGYMKFLSKEVNQFHEYFKKQEEKQQQIQRDLQAEQQLRAYFEGSAGAFSTKFPDSADANDHFFNVRRDQLMAMSEICPDFRDPNKVEEYLAQELKTIVAQCAAQNLNPAEQLYKLAQKFGYKSKNAAQPNNAETQAAPQTDNAQKLQKLSASQAASKTLTNTGGGQNATFTRFEDVNSMSEAEFSRWYANQQNQDMISYLH